jgi:hypothetical protein
MKKFLRATFFIESDNEEARRHALDLVRYAGDDCERVVRLFKFVRDGISYSLLFSFRDFPPVLIHPEKHLGDLI